MNLLAHGTRRAVLALALGAAALLGACGGGDPVVPFEPRRVLAFGDENSVITRRAASTPSMRCRQEPTTSRRSTVPATCCGSSVWPSTSG